MRCLFLQNPKNDLDSKKQPPYFIVFQLFDNSNLRCEKVILHTWPDEVEKVKEI